MAAPAPDIVAVADAFATASIDGSHWFHALGLLADATGSARSQLIGIGGPKAIPFNWVTDFPDRAVQEFIDIEGGRPEVNQRVLPSLDAGLLEVVSERDYAAAIPDLKTGVYLDYCRDYDIPNGCQTKLFEDSDGLIGLALLRTRQDGPTSAAQRAVFERIAPLVRSAVKVQRLLESDGEKLIAGTFEAMANAAFICDGGGRIRQSTPGGERFLQQGALLAHGRFLATHDRQSSHALHAAIVRACGPAPSPLQTIVVSCADKAPAMLLDIVSLPRRTAHLDFLPKALVIVREKLRDTAASAQLLRVAFKLSMAEAEVAVEIAAGRDAALIAHARGVSVETIRSQIKSIFQKTDVRRQTELAAIVARFR